MILSKIIALFIYGDRRSLRVKFIISIVSIISIFGFIATFGVYFFTRNNLIQQKKIQLLDSTVHMSYEIARIMDFSVKLALTVAQDPQLDLYLSGDSVLFPEEFNQYLSKYNIGQDYQAIYLTDNIGNTIASTDIAFIGHNFSFRDYFQKAIMDKSGIETAIGVISKKLGYYFSAPVKNSLNNITGVVVVKLNPDLINNILITEVIEENVNPILTDNFGLVLFSKDQNKIYKSLAPLSDVQKKEINQQQKYEGVDIKPLSYDQVYQMTLHYDKPTTFDFYDKNDNEEEIVTLSKINQYPFFLIAESEKEDIVKPAFYYALFVALLVLICTVSAALFISFIIRRFLRPIDKLKAMTLSFSQGNFDKKETVNSKDELEDLSVSISSMADNLKDLYQNLEKKVEDRTHDLEKFKLAVEYASDHIVITDIDGMIIYANKAVERITGFKANEIIGKKAGGKDLWGGLMDNKFYQKLWTTIKDKKQIFSGEINNRRANGENYIALGNIAPVIDEDKVIFFVGIERDISRDKQLERAKDEFLSIASHELRTPLAAIDGIVSMMLNGDYGIISNELKEGLTDVNSASERLIKLVNDLLSLSRIQAGRLKYNVTKFSLKPVVIEVFKLFEVVFKSKNLKLILGDISSVDVSADADKIKQVLNNLLSNSLKFTDNGSITINTEDSKDYLKVSITDTGCGINEADQDKLFGKFQQVGTQKGRPTGTGLGLHISREMVRKMGGDLYLEKSEPGKGSKFVFTIPKIGSLLAKKALEVISLEAKENPDQKSDTINKT